MDGAHVALADQVARELSRRFPRHLDREDVQQMARLSLVELDHDGKQLHPLAIRNRTIDKLRAQEGETRKERPVVHSLEAVRERMQGVELDALTHDPTEDVDAFIAAVDAEGVIDDPRWRLVVFLRYHADYGLRDIAEVLGISHPMVSKILRKAHERLAPRLLAA